MAQGGRATVGYSLFDLTPRLSGCYVILTSQSTGKVAQRVALPPQPTAGSPGAGWALTKRFTVKVPRGTYDVKIAGSWLQDEAGNRLVSAVCRTPLIVK